MVDECGFRGAARRLELSQATITQHVKKLEADLGAPLVKRRHSACVVTPQGEVFLPLARRLLSLAERARCAVRAPSLIIGASSNIGTYLLQPAVKEFMAMSASEDAVSLSLAPNPEIAERLSLGEVDVGLMEWWDHRPGYRATIWRREPMVVIVPPGHVLADADCVSMDTLSSTPMIGGEPGTGTATLIKELFGDVGRLPAIALSLGSTEAVKQAVRAGLGVSLVMAGAVEDEVKAGQLHALPVAGVELRKPIFVILPDDMPETSRAASFARFLLQRLK